MIKQITLAILYTHYRAITFYKIGSWFYKRKMFKTSYFIKSLGITLNGCDISPAAKIGKNLTLPHTPGVVIGEGAIIGDNVTIYQNVTIGTKDGKKPFYPIVGNDVTIFSGSVIAGDVKIGNNCIVGANAVVLTDIPSGSVAFGIPAKTKTRN